MPTPLEKLTSDWQANYSDMPMATFVQKVHAKMYSDMPYADFTDKLGITVPPEVIKPEPPPMAPIEGASPWEAGDVPEPPTAGQVVRHGLPIVAGVAGGMVPGAGVVAGPLAAATTDLALSKIYGEGDGGTERDTSFLTDVGIGVLPSTAKAGIGVVKKLIPAPIEKKIANVIKWGMDKGIRPSVVGKSNAPQAEKYYEKAQSAVESIIENKPNLQFTDEAGNAIKGELPKNLHQFSGAIDQTKRGIFKKYDSMVKTSDDLGKTVDLNPIVGELKLFTSNKVNKIAGGSGIGRAQDLTMEMAGNKLTLSEAQDLLAILNGRTKAFIKNPTPDMASGFAVDTMTANQLRMAIDSAVENVSYLPLRKQYGALREIEKEVQNRATVDARKNVVGLIDFADIATAAEAARALATMNPGAAGAAGAMKVIKEWYKHLNNPNRVIKSMFYDTERLIGKRLPNSTQSPFAP
jgi:hypothetical protein